MTDNVTIESELTIAKKNIGKDIDLAMAGFVNALAMAMQAEDVSAEAEVRHFYAQALFSQGKFTQAIIEIKQALALREGLNERAKLAASLNSMAIFLSEIGDFAGALQAGLRSLVIKEELGDKRAISVGLLNIGHIYTRLGKPDEEAKMYERSLSIAMEIGDKELIAANHLNLSFLYSKSGEPAKALAYLKGLDEMFLSLGDKTNAAYALNHTGFVYYKMKEYQPALDSYFACLNLSRQTGNVSGIESALMNIGEAMIHLGNAHDAKPYIDEAIEMAQHNEQRATLKEAKHILSEYYEKTGDYKSAYETYRSYTDLKDELINLDNLKQISELKMKYDIDKKEKEAEINYLKNVELKEAFDNLHKEKMRSDELLLNILPGEVAEELKQTGTAKAKRFDSATVMFIDIRNFTVISQQLTPEELVGELDTVFRGFDEIIKRYDIEKIKTIGDAYMCVAGVPIASDNHAEKIAQAAFDIADFIEGMKTERLQNGKAMFEVRIGINTGPIVAGIVGSSKFAYDIWGDTVNTAARMEQSSLVGKINISGNTYELLKDKYKCFHRGKVHAKNKGEIDMYFLER